MPTEIQFECGVEIKLVRIAKMSPVTVAGILWRLDAVYTDAFVTGLQAVSGRAFLRKWIMRYLKGIS